MDRNRLFDALSRYFDTNELENLCFQLGIDYDDLAGDSKSGKARELIELLIRSNRMHELTHLVLQERPQLANEFAETKTTKTPNSQFDAPPATMPAATKLAIIGSVLTLLISFIGVAFWLSRPRESVSKDLPASTLVPIPTDTLVPATATRHDPAIGAVETVTPTTAPPRMTQTPNMRCDASTWFFDPHPDLELQNFRATQVTIQFYQGGARMVWIQDQNQTWVLFADRTWTNLSGDIEDVYAQVAAQVGVALGAPLSYQALMGHSVSSDAITAYVSDPATAIMQWSVDVKSNTVRRWNLVEPAVLRDCPQGHVQPPDPYGLRREMARGD